MSEKTNEELAQWWLSAADDPIWTQETREVIAITAARLRQQSEEIDYMTARRAMSLFNHEFVGQDGKELWAWALGEARKA